MVLLPPAWMVRRPSASHMPNDDSLRILTDSNGAVVGTADYTPFGAVAQATGTRAPQGFTGEFQDTGLVYLRARYYHPTLGRFLTPDSIVPDATNGQDWNAYAYVRNDPWNWVDPDGHHPVLAFAARAALAYAAPLAAYGLADQLMKLDPDAQAWWNKQPCDCQEPEPSAPGQIPWFDLSYSALVTAGLAWKTTPSQRTVQLEAQVRPRFGWNRTWRTVNGPTRVISDRYARDLWTHRYRSRHLLKQARMLVTKPELIPQGGPLGLWAGLGYGALGDMVLQGMNDAGRCLSPRDHAYNLAMAAAFSGIGGLTGAGAFSAARLAGFGKTFSAVAGGLAGFGAANNPVTNSWKGTLLR